MRLAPALASVRSLLPLLICTLLILCMPPACAAQIGSSADQTLKTVNKRNGGPSQVTLVDADGTWTVEGTGPARRTILDAKGFDTLQVGAIPRDIGYLTPDGTRLFLSSGTDFEGEIGELYNPATGNLIAKGVRLKTSASAPLTALAQIEEFVTAYHAARDEASKAAIIEQMRAVEGVSKAVVEGVIEAIVKP